MDNFKAPLKRLGFSEGEIKVYLALLELGEASYTELGRATGIKRTSVYPIAHKLQERGVVNYQVDTRKLSALLPDELLTSLQKDVLRVHRLIPQLKELTAHNQSVSRVKFYSGAEGIKRALYEKEQKLPPKKSRWRYVIGDINEWVKFWRTHDPEFLPEWFKHNKRMGYKCKTLWSGTSEEPFTNGSVPDQDLEGKFLPPNYRVPFDMEIRPSYIVITNIKGNKPYAIRITSTELAQAMATFFEYTWSFTK